MAPVPASALVHTPRGARGSSWFGSRMAFLYRQYEFPEQELASTAVTNGKAAHCWMTDMMGIPGLRCLFHETLYIQSDWLVFDLPETTKHVASIVVPGRFSRDGRWLGYTLCQRLPDIA
jgi:hypothetical protein